jgi:V/A-type H+-transporting ATPase subunit I
MIRPQPATWFEILVAREDALIAIEALAREACAEFESVRPAEPRSERLEATRLLREYAQLAHRYRRYWPAVELPGTAARATPVATLARAVEVLKAWARAADRLVNQAQLAEAELAALALWERVLEYLGDSAIDLDRLAGAGPDLEAALFVFREPAAAVPPHGVLARELDTGEGHLVLVVGIPEAVEAYARQAAARQGQRVAIPSGLGTGSEQDRARLGARRAARQHELATLQGALGSLNARHGLADALADVVRAAWCCQNVGTLDAAGIFSRITGWTDDPRRLAAALERSGARALAHFPPAPRGAQPPLVLRNPRWVQPFEVFSRLLGMPGRAGADPSALLAVIVPLLFGYMFGDVGQGAVLVAAGFALRKRFPVLRLLIAGGLSAIAFGFAFGSVFSVEAVVPALWVRPLAAPILVLAVPLAAGAALLAFGLLLGALEARWAGELRHWLWAESGFILLYLGILGGLFDVAGWYLAAVGAGLSVLGNAHFHGTWKAAAAALGRLAEKTAQILVNTLSFVRVGAFALAHAGLSAAVVALAEGAGDRAAYAVVLALGNVLIIALEALVVSVQTTRLVLFEFFARFFVAEGREFRPLRPPSAAEESLHEAKA